MFFISFIADHNEANTLKYDEEYVVKLYSDMIYGISLSQLKNTHDAEDALQETFFTYFKKNERFKDEEHRKAWLIRVTLNCCKRIIAYNRKHFSISIDEVVVPCELETKEDNCVYNAVLSLREKYRTAIYLFYFEDLPAKEIARILKTSEANIFMSLSRGRNMLKEKLEGVVDL